MPCLIRPRESGIVWREKKGLSKKDENGKTIGIETLYVSKTAGVDKPLPVEVVVA